MTLQQLSDLKRWHVAHRRDHPVEFQVWDAMLTCWVIGCVGAPAALVIAQPLALAGCAVLFFAPSIYVAMRRQLHRAHRLRCDWLSAVPATPTQA